jgi:hypothetical protein
VNPESFTRKGINTNKVVVNGVPFDSAIYNGNKPWKFTIDWDHDAQKLLITDDEPPQVKSRK